jgi:hypothetical protein
VRALVFFLALLAAAPLGRGPEWEEVPEDLRIGLARELGIYLDMRRAGNWEGVYARLSPTWLRHAGSPSRAEYVEERRKIRLRRVEVLDIQLVAGLWDRDPFLAVDLCLAEGKRKTVRARGAMIEASLHDGAWLFSDPVVAEGLDGEPLYCEILVED